MSNVGQIMPPKGFKTWAKIVSKVRYNAHSGTPFWKFVVQHSGSEMTAIYVLHDEWYKMDEHPLEKWYRRIGKFEEGDSKMIRVREIQEYEGKFRAVWEFVYYPEPIYRTPNLRKLTKPTKRVWRPGNQHA